MSKREAGVVRRIYFYRIERKDEFLKALPGEIERIGNLPFEEDGRYLFDADGNRLTVWPDSFEYPLKMRFGKTRLSNLPTKERAGKLEPLDLAVDEGLVELSHVVIYGDGFVAAEFNHEGPRIRRLGEYFFEKAIGLSDRPNFLPLFQKDILKQIANMNVVRLIELKGSPSAEHLLSTADKDLGQAYGVLGKLGANKSIELGMAAENRPDSRLGKLALKLANIVASRPAESREQMRRLKITGFNEDGQIDIVDLLEEKLIAFKTIERKDENRKALSSTSAYQQIDLAYNERRDQLLDAVEGRVFL